MPDEEKEVEHDGDCDDCTYFLSNTERCVLHGTGDTISPEGWCKHWRAGLLCTLESLGFTPTGATTKERSGYKEDAESGEEESPAEAKSYEEHRKVREKRGRK